MNPERDRNFRRRSRNASPLVFSLKMSGDRNYPLDLSLGRQFLGKFTTVETAKEWIGRNFQRVPWELELVD
jgi:hypothetical protein